MLTGAAAPKLSGCLDRLEEESRLGLLSLQRREDIVMWPKSAVDLEQNTIKVSPGRRRITGSPCIWRLPWAGVARGRCRAPAIAGCVPVLDPLLAEGPQRSQQDAKLHWNAVTPDYLTKSFAQARDDSEAYKDMPAGERPTFHEIHALGAWLYEQQGSPQDTSKG